ncbi:MAG: hypothetical protein GXP29_15175 [Planctomycetes bacterium]|nr:hypothetical protein [Planctomycetota bacterium]
MEQRYCLQCAYSLLHLETNRCPECGLPFDPAKRRSFEMRPSRTPFAVARILPKAFLIALAHIIILVSTVNVMSSPQAPLDWSDFPIGIRILAYPLMTALMYGPDIIYEGFRSVAVAIPIMIAHSMCWGLFGALFLEWRRACRLRNIPRASSG